MFIHLKSLRPDIDPLIQSLKIIPYPMQLGTPLHAMSSVYGKIEQLLLVFSGDPSKTTRETILEDFGSMFRAFGDRVAFILLCNYEKKLDPSKYVEVRDGFNRAFNEALEASHLHPSHHLIHLPAPMTTPWEEVCKDRADFNHSEFIQDPFVVMQNQYGESVLMESYRSLNPKNQYVAEQVAAATGKLVRPTELWVEGGNILVGNDFALVGRNLLHHNLELLYKGCPPHEPTGGPEANDTTTPYNLITGRFKRLLGVRYLIWIGNDAVAKLKFKVDQGKYKAQPFFHLDHFLTLAGMSKDGDELVLMGTIDYEHVSGPREKYKDDIRILNGLLKEVEGQLRKSGHDQAGPRFEFMPLPMGGKIVENSKGEARFTPLSYNNCQVEWFHGIRRIYMPKYMQTEALEKGIAEDLIGKGFPHFPFIKFDLDFYAESGGSLHCLTKVLKRSAY